MVFKRISLAVFQKNKLLTENLQEGGKNWSLIEKKGLCIENVRLMPRKKHCGYLGKSLLDPSTKCNIVENTHMMDSLLKRQIQESTKLGLKPLRNGVRNGA